MIKGLLGGFKCSQIFSVLIWKSCRENGIKNKWFKAVHARLSLNGDGAFQDPHQIAFVGMRVKIRTSNCGLAF